MRCNKTEEEEEEEDRSFMSADMLLVERKRTQTVLSVFGFAKSHLRLLLSVSMRRYDTHQHT